MNFKNMRNLIDDVKSWSQQIGINYNYIIGVPDSGLLVSHLLSIYTGKPLRSCHYNDTALVVDDTFLTGKTMSWWKKHYPHAKYGAVYVKPGMERKLHTHYESLAPPRMFEWNFFKSRHLENSMMDIDGILCRNPMKHEIDYGPKMAEFYQTVKPRMIPSVTVGKLVTCRLNKYRPMTVMWLKENGIRFGELVMRDSRKQGHGEFKAKIYKNSKAILFIESPTKQSRVIAKLSGKPVLCCETMEML